MRALAPLLLLLLPRRGGAGPAHAEVEPGGRGLPVDERPAPDAPACRPAEGGDRPRRRRAARLGRGGAPGAGVAPAAASARWRCCSGSASRPRWVGGTSPRSITRASGIPPTPTTTTSARNTFPSWATSGSTCARPSPTSRRACARQVEGRYLRDLASNQLTTRGRRDRAPGDLHGALLARALGRLPARHRLVSQPRVPAPLAGDADRSRLQRDARVDGARRIAREPRRRQRPRHPGAAPDRPAAARRHVGRRHARLRLARRLRRGALLGHQLPGAIRLDGRAASCARAGWWPP